MIPRIVVVAAQDPLVWKPGTFHAGDDVVRRHRTPVEFHCQAHLGRPGANVVGGGQGAAPFAGSDGALQRLEQWQGVGV